MSRFLTLAVLMCSLAFGTLAAVQLPDGSFASVTETVLVKLPAEGGDVVADIVLSDDLSRCALIMIDGRAQGYLLYEGKKSPKYECLVAYFAGKHLVYEACKDDDTSLLAVNGKVLPECEQILVNTDGSRLAFVYRSKGKYSVEIDGKRGPAFDYISSRDWMADGRLRYLGERGRELVIMLNHEQRAVIPAQGPHRFPRISPDNTRIAYVEKETDDRYFLRVDEQRFGPHGYEEIAGLTFSPDSTRYVAEIVRQEEGKPDDIRLLIDGTLSPSYQFVWGAMSDDDGQRTAFFGSDSKRLAYAAQLTPEAWVLVVDGKASETVYVDMGPPIFSADSRHLGCIVAAKDGEAVYWSVLVDGKEQRRFPHEIWGLEFSPDFRRWHVERVVEREDGEQERFILTSDGAVYRNIKSSPPCYTRDSRHLVYLAHNGKAYESEEYRLALHIDGVKVSDDYPSLLSKLRLTERGTIQTAVVKTITPSRGKPYQAVVRVETAIGMPKGK